MNCTGNGDNLLTKPKQTDNVPENGRSGPAMQLRPCSDGNAIVPLRSEKWTAEGLRSDGNTSNRTVPFQKLDLLNT